MTDLKPNPKILIIRFRQIGDTVLTMALCATVRRSLPSAVIHLILNKEIAPLFEGHPHLDKIITFDRTQIKTVPSYWAWVSEIVDNTPYDVIIDMRSTVQTLLFSALSRNTPYRIGRGKWYSKPFLTHILPKKEVGVQPMIEQNLMFAKPLEAETTILYKRDFKLFLYPEETAQFKAHMINNGIDFNWPVVLIGVSAKRPEKRWKLSYMTEVISRMLSQYPRHQLIFNAAPGHEEMDVRQIYESLRYPSSVFIDLKARSLRELALLCSLSDFYFGNEGGARHVAHSFDVPSFVVVSPSINKAVWLPKNSVPAEGIAWQDVLTSDQSENMDFQSRYDAVTPDIVWRNLNNMLAMLCGESGKAANCNSSLSDNSVWKSSSTD